MCQTKVSYTVQTKIHYGQWDDCVIFHTLMPKNTTSSIFHLKTRMIEINNIQGKEINGI